MYEEILRCKMNCRLRVLCEISVNKIAIRDFVARRLHRNNNVLARFYLTFYLLVSHCQLACRFPGRGARIKIPCPIVYVCRYTSGRVLMRTVRGKEKTCYYPYPSTQEDSEEHLTPKRFHSRPPSKEDLSPSRYLLQYRMLLLISSLILALLR